MHGIPHIPNIHCVPEKQASWCSTITLANADRFSKFFTGWFVRKFSLQRFPHHLHYVGTLPREIRKSKNVTKFSCWIWQYVTILKLNVKSYVTCYKNVALMILYIYVYNMQKNEDSVQNNHAEKITQMQQHSTRQCSTVDSRCRLTNFKMLVSQSVWAVLRQSV